MYYWYSYFLKHEGWTLLLFLSPINNKNYISRTQSIIWVVYSKLNFTKRPLRDKDSRYELTWLLASTKWQFATQRFWQDCKRCHIEHLIKKWTLELGLVYCSGRKRVLLELFLLLNCCQELDALTGEQNTSHTSALIKLFSWSYVPLYQVKSALQRCHGQAPAMPVSKKTTS